jgi:molecular chaperone DnaK (HSP70)
MGRIMPSIVRIVENDDNNNVDKNTHRQTLVGAEADTTTTTSSSLLQSVKRLLGKKYDDLDPEWIQTLDYDILPATIEKQDNKDHDSSIRLVARTSSTTAAAAAAATVELTPQDVLSIELQALRIGSQEYLNRYINKKNMKVPGDTTNDKMNNFAEIRNVVVGIPAHFSKRHIQLLEEACRKAGFDGHISTCLESTAAAMAYGLTMQDNSRNNDTSTPSVVPTIMVIDMGGGTTDITIAHKQRQPDDEEQEHHDDDKKYSSYQVLVTEGDDELGGDDIDEAIMDYCLKQRMLTKSTKQKEKEEKAIRYHHHHQLRSRCRNVKEALCRIDDVPSTSETIKVDDQKVIITQETFEQIIQPWLQRAKELILKAKEELATTNTNTHFEVNEVILVGGTTRIPGIRRMIQDIFPNIELSTALNPMSSVAQGLAIQAAICSKLVPVHELKSALMLDCVPHSIGVQLGEGGTFVEIIPRNTPLPARGSSSFTLADKYQAGVTIHAVEKVGIDTYEPMSKEDFTFLLRRLTPAEFDRMSERTIEVGMKVDTDGKFIVSVFDENDPEQVRKKERFERTRDNQEVVGELGYIKDMVLAESGISTEQLFLFMTLLGVLVLYVAVKMAFTDPTEIEGSATILG